MLKKICIGAALCWTVNILYLCLIRISELPEIKISYIDKYIHAFFYFVFSLLWFYALQFYFKRVSRKKLFVVVVLMAFVFGIAIELFQTFLTTSRSGDVIDVVANTAGSLLAILLIRFLGKNLFLNKIQE
ncbi:VanZ family protein [Flavobacterium sp. GSA192]|uniref:VanZ family protein n=1 Tax=Flavobacterium sp. GSA192 TaxID=2576304 RepID=UPI0015E32678|nr:VanZ family protein [Flavobacterium sp. GSA192]